MEWEVRHLPVIAAALLLAFAVSKSCGAECASSSADRGVAPKNASFHYEIRLDICGLEQK